MQEIAGLHEVKVDTTARGFFRSARDRSSLKADLSQALKGLKLELTEVALAELSEPWDVSVVDVKGLG